MATDHSVFVCSEQCRATAEREARNAFGNGGPLFIAWLDELKPIVGAYRRRTQSIRHGDTKAWSIWRDLAAQVITLRDGESEGRVWRTTWRDSTRARQQRALKQLGRAPGAHDRSGFYKFLIALIATRVKELRGKWPSCSGASKYGGADVLRVRDWLNYVFCPWHRNPWHPDRSRPGRGCQIIVKCLKTLRKAEPRLSRDMLQVRLHLRAAYEVLQMLEAKLATPGAQVGEMSNELRALQEMKVHLKPLVAQWPDWS